MVAPRIAEVDLDHALAEGILVSDVLRQLILAGGRFRRFSADAILLSEEQAAARRAKHWWKHWWTRLPDGSESETDIFLVFESAEETRFAIHIENKPPAGVLTLKQAADYRRRAAFKANDMRWLNYSDFEAILLAPQSFLDANQDAASQFDRQLSYEAVAPLVPLFAAALAGQ